MRRMACWGDIRSRTVDLGHDAPRIWRARALRRAPARGLGHRLSGRPGENRSKSGGSLMAPGIPRFAPNPQLPDLDDSATRPLRAMAVDPFLWRPRESSQRNPEGALPGPQVLEEYLQLRRQKSPCRIDGMHEDFRRRPIRKEPDKFSTRDLSVAIGRWQ
jgi:hypothetical protein